MSKRGSFVARWSPRVGKRAARLAWSSSRATLAGLWTAPVWIVLFLLGPGWSRIAAYVLAAVGALLLTYGAIALHVMYQTLSRRYQVRVTWRDSPTLRWKRFSTWCELHGVDPVRGRRLDRIQDRHTPEHPRRDPARSGESL